MRPDDSRPPSRPSVSARAVLQALSEVRRRGQWPLFQELGARGGIPFVVNLYGLDLTALDASSMAQIIITAFTQTALRIVER